MKEEPANRLVRSDELSDRAPYAYAAMTVPGASLILTAGACPLDATRLEPRGDGIDLAVHQTLNHGGSVRALARERHELGPVEGIAALLRY